MSRLNRKFISEVKVALCESVFSTGDFTFEYPEDGDCYLKILFKYNDGFCFEVIEREEVDAYTETGPFSSVIGGTIKRRDKITNCYVHCSPGEHKVSDKISLSDIGSAIQHIESWCISIYSEISSEPLTSSEEAFRDEIEKSFPCDEIKNEYEVASSDEQVEFANKIDELYVKFETINEKANIAIEEMNSIKKELEALKDSSKTIPKGIWHKMARNKIVDITIKFIKTPEGKKLVISGVKKLFQLG